MSFGFAILDFFIPLVSLFLFLIYEEKKLKRAKDAGKDALIGFIIKIVLSIVLVILYVVFADSLFSNITNNIDSNIFFIGDVFREETTDEILEKYVDVSFGEFKVSNNRYYSETLLDITVKNKAEKQCTYFITIEVVSTNGAGIGIVMIYADRWGRTRNIFDCF